MTDRVEKNADRMLIALYRLTKGRVGVQVPTVELFTEVKREALFDLTEEQFDAYKERVSVEVADYHATYQRDGA